MSFRIRSGPASLVLALAMGGALGACGSFPYRLDIQQGNVVTQEQVSQLERGMDKRKVQFVLGTPLVVDAFHQDRWDYIYSFQEGGGSRVQRRLSVFFEDGALVRVDGDVEPAEGMPDESGREGVVVSVPDQEPDGIFGRLGSIFGGD
ncbi:MAG: outer membrane protein assembly factor BamE [Gammaproteobacteria bacterium]|nr:outer membrane protein assembly factor BamE [Gammaproteobacteria bacterium]NIR82840.1 outer membrane protein assembly factor BamE [Gammaproteobacteria bacterium]NIR89949.1 outer membrane protein assembly factor BamE [Gammaproteobacteria bacterium]NIU03998.1 outer membrane protein assembly factor BamE [Gammaproteobacteria bacterium]NIV51318.1 outer membrane protein assembly factor BamE [Gammaproteobacteria bacterium]